MTQGFQHQTLGKSCAAPRTEPRPQNGQKSDEACLQMEERRSFQPRPGH